MAHTATVAETAQDAYNAALTALANAAADVVDDADAGRLVAHDSIEMLRGHVETWEAARREYFGPPIRELRRPPYVHPAPEEIEP